jgi:hypothetical protein
MKPAPPVIKIFFIAKVSGSVFTGLMDKQDFGSGVAGFTVSQDYGTQHPGNLFIL